MSKFAKLCTSLVLVLKAAQYHHAAYPQDFIFGLLFIVAGGALTILTLAAAMEWVSDAN